MKVPVLLMLYALLGFAAGCGSGTNLAPVSGRVTVDGKPYPDARVLFQPTATKGNPNPGRGSMGITDTDGKFTLKYDDGRAGAVVGKHIVRVSTVQPIDAPSGGKVSDTGSEDGESPSGKGGSAKFRPEVIPQDWNTDSLRKFDVSAGGTDQANFEITSVPGTRKSKK